MSWLSRLIPGRPTAPPARHTVVIADDIASELGADDTELTGAVEQALREHLEIRRRVVDEPDRMPFWLRRETLVGAEMEDELRDRVTQRRSGEAEG